jgi:AAA15 family ATPase/GTPase
MLSKIILDKERYSGYKFLNNENALTGLCKINIFIGQNNTGKSRFLRTLFTDNEFEFNIKKNDFSRVIALVKEKHTEVRSILDSIHISDADSTFKQIDTVLKQTGNFKMGNVKNYVEKVRSLAEYYINIKNYSGYSYHANVISTGSPDRIIPKINNIGKEIYEFLYESFGKDFDYKIEKIYIPMLKGLRPIQQNLNNEFKEQKDNYKARTIRDYFSGLDEVKIASEIFTGLSLYEDSKKLLLGDKAGRDRIKKFEEFLSQNFFEGKEVTLIPDINNDVLLIGIGDEERPVYQLGDGIQSVIILLYPLFFNQDKNLLVFIEEPENSLHPGMQRIFLETLMKEDFKNFQYFITTHSNHFLDITLDLNNISIYSFSKIKNKESNTFLCQIENTSNDDVKILDLIGARNASVFLSNCTIWVEGITDRLYLKKYLEIYQQHQISKGELKILFREDFNYSFVEYGGGNIVHWSFTNELGWDKIQTNRLSSKIFIVADKDSSEDKPNSAKALRLAQLKEKLSDRFKIINGREIENTLSEKILIDTIRSLEKENAINIKYDYKKIMISKYQDQKLGKFIETNFLQLKRKYKAESGTIYCKLEFCKTALELITTFEDLSTEAINISECIYNFIKDSNE